MTADNNATSSSGVDVEKQCTEAVAPQTPEKTRKINVPLSPASEATTPLTPGTQSSSTPSADKQGDKARAPSPPRWRFVNEAKKSAGYNSLFAGRHVQGTSADELGAKYVPPDISLYRKEKEGTDVGKLTIEEFEKQEDELLEGEFPGLPIFEAPEVEPKKEFKEWDTNIELSPKKERETEWFDGEVKDDYRVGDDVPPEKEGREVGKLTIPTNEAENEIFTGQFVLPPKNDDAECNINDTELEQKKPIEDGMQSTTSTKEEEGSSNSDVNKEAAIDISDEKPLNRDKKHRCLYLLLLLLLLVVVVLGVLLEKKSKPEDGAAALRAIPILVPLQNNTSAPSTIPSDTPSTSPTITVLPLTEEVSYRPSFSPSLAPSLQRTNEPKISSSNNPSSLPTLSSTNEPSVFPSVSPSQFPSFSPTEQCSSNSSTFSIDYLDHNVLAARNNTSYPATWKIREVCSGEVIRECLPCSLGTLVISGRNTRVGTKSVEKDFERITECLPSDGEYMFEIYPTYGTGCCGFDPTIYTASYENAIFMKGYLATESPEGDQDENEDKYNVHSGFFGERKSPCPTEQPSSSPTLTTSEAPSSSPSIQPTLVPSDPPSNDPSLRPSILPTSIPSTNFPTKSPVIGVGGCPDSYVPMSYYEIGSRAEVEGIVYECTSYACGTFGFDPGDNSSSLWRQAWQIIGECSGTIAPTLSPTTPKPTSPPTSPPTSSPTKYPTAMPSHPPTNIPTPIPTQPAPTASPTCTSEKDFNVCIALDMSGSVCNAGSIFGNECYGCSPAMFCQSFFVSKNTCCHNFQAEVDFSRSIVESLGNLPTEKSFVIVQFGDWAVLASGLASYEDTYNSLNWLDYSGGATNHADAISLCQETLASSSYSDRENFIIIITDGVSTLPMVDPSGSALAAADAAKSAGTFVIPVFISPTYDGDKIGFMSDLSSKGEVFDVSDFESLSTIEDMLVNQVSCQS
mmetsp:Transcript_23173/g.48952  ORF Transcript_23173/g.48952 Transcript_23173/m.48952 type:complete len:965 (-) Transcript_23173:77-2971(-)